MLNVTGGVWKTTSVKETPELTLANWQVYEVADDGRVTRHFVGYNVTEQEGRASSGIVSFDATTMRGVTASGRVYQLLDGPGYDGDAEYVWERWKQINGAKIVKNVTEEIIK